MLNQDLDEMSRAALLASSQPRHPRQLLRHHRWSLSCLQLNYSDSCAFLKAVSNWTLSFFCESVRNPLSLETPVVKANSPCWADGESDSHAYEKEKRSATVVCNCEHTQQPS
jgi:hypothetical protein